MSSSSLCTSFQAAQIAAKNFVYTKKDLKKILIKHPNISEELKSFLTDPNYKYDPRAYDFGIEQDFGVLYLAPQENLQDNNFLSSLEKEYPAEINEMRSSKDLEHTAHGGSPLRRDHSTRFANNNIVQFLYYSQGYAERTAIVRKIIYHLLTKE